MRGAVDVEGIQEPPEGATRASVFLPLLAPPVGRAAASWGWRLEPEWEKEMDVVELWVE